MIRTLCALGALLLLTACSGGGGGGGGSSSGGGGSTPPPALTNFTTITVDQGPAILNTGPNAYTQSDVAFVSVTICAPGTTNCQTIDHVILDTGSVGLRLIQSVVNTSVLSALPSEMDGSNNPVGQCYQYVDGYVFGSVREADFQIGGESVSSMPLQVIGDTGRFTGVPASCSSAGGQDLDTVQAFGANGIIGIGVTATDCGSTCQIPGGYTAAIYYDCPSSGCQSIITRSSTTTAPFQQLPNPVAAMSVDNNGTLVSLPAATSDELSMTGTLYFGIGTETNNGLGSATVLPTTTSSNAYGPGLLTAVYKSQNLVNSFVDSGSSLYFFVDTSITGCSASGFFGYYCPATPLSLTPTLVGTNNSSASAAFTLDNAETQFASSDAVVPGVGGNPNDFPNLMPYPSSFDFGLPFFYGRNIYTAIEGRSAGGVAGPYVAY